MIFDRANGAGKVGSALMVGAFISPAGLIGAVRRKGRA